MLFPKSVYRILVFLFSSLTVKYISFIVICYFLCHAEPTTIAEIPVPQGYTRLTFAPGAYSNWITALPLKPDKSIKTWNGGMIAEDYYHVLAVVALPLLFKQDLEQCADFAFRLWADYHFKNNLLDRLYLFDYIGTRKYFKTSKKTYSSFLKWTMAHANSFSIKKGCAKATETDLRPGDMVVQNEKGGIGHVSVIMSACKSDPGDRLFLIGFSFMPAQEFHIEYAQPPHGKEGWYTLEGFYLFLREFLDLGDPILRRFDEK
jgi:hypothetical protein